MSWIELFGVEGGVLKSESDPSDLFSDLTECCLASTILSITTWTKFYGVRLKNIHTNLRNDNTVS